MEKNKLNNKPDGYDPILVQKQTEKIVVSGNKRKYANLARPLRFYGGVTSATEVGCNLRCKFCFSNNPVWKPHDTGEFYSPIEVFNKLSLEAIKNKHNLISASASEGTIGKQHLLQLLDLVEHSGLIYILETNGMMLGFDKEYVSELSKYKNLHVRVSIKGSNEVEYNKLTGASTNSYELPFIALRNLIDAKVSCNACVMVSFSAEEEIKKVKDKLYKLYPGLLKSLELEVITLFPKVADRLSQSKIKPLYVRRFGKNIIYKNIINA